MTLFAPHGLAHHPLCRDEDGKLECVCGLGDRPVNDQRPDEDWYDPDDREPPPFPLLAEDGVDTW